MRKEKESEEIGDCTNQSGKRVGNKGGYTTKKETKGPDILPRLKSGDSFQERPYRE